MQIQLMMLLSIIGSRCWLVYLTWRLTHDMRSANVHSRFCLICWMREEATSHSHFGKVFSTEFYFQYLIMWDMLEKKLQPLEMVGFEKLLFMPYSCYATFLTHFTRYHVSYYILMQVEHSFFSVCIKGQRQTTRI